MRAALRPAGPAEVVVLARACFFTAVVTGATVLVPYSATAPRRLGAVLAVAALLLGLVLRRGAHRTPVAVVHGVLVLATTLVALCVAESTTPNGTVTTATSFLWIVLYTAVFHSRRAVLVHLGLVSVGLTAGLVLAGISAVPQTVGFLLAMMGSVAWVVQSKVTGLRDEAMNDALTGVLSRRAFLTAAGLEVARAGRTGSPSALLLVDLDDFKRVNDGGGHAAGDALLVRLTRAWSGALRTGDVLGRLGGDEFAVLLPGADEERAHGVVDRLRAVSGGTGWSVGVAPWAGEDVETWLHRADEAMYAAKSSPRPGGGQER